EPAAHEWALVPRDLQGRARVEQKRPLRVEPYLHAERLAVALRPPREPVIEGVRTNDRNRLARNAVQVDRLGPLRFVPHVRAIWWLAHEALVRQVVPAVDREDHG